MKAIAAAFICGLVTIGCDEVAGPRTTCLVVVTQPNCPPCERLKPILARLAAEGYRVQEIGVADAPTPTLLFFSEDGELLHTHEGFMPYAQIKAILGG